MQIKTFPPEFYSYFLPLRSRCGNVTGIEMQESYIVTPKMHPQSSYAINIVVVVNCNCNNVV